VTVEPCDPTAIRFLEATEKAQDASFAQEQKDAEARQEVESKREAEAQAQRQAQAQRKAQAKKEAEERLQVVQEQPPPEPSKPDVQVNLVFCGTDGNSVTLQLVKRPIGLVFDLLGSRLRVKSVVPGSFAEDSGVKFKMVLTMINGESIADNSTDQAWERVKIAVGKLPGK